MGRIAGVGVIAASLCVTGLGDVAFEINQPGDVVSIQFVGFPDGGETTVQDGHVTAQSRLLADNVTLVVTGYVGDGVDPANTEQRIIEAALTATDVARRDIRAIPGPAHRCPQGWLLLDAGDRRDSQHLHRHLSLLPRGHCRDRRRRFRRARWPRHGWLPERPFAVRPAGADEHPRRQGVG